MRCKTLCAIILVLIGVFIIAGCSKQEGKDEMTTADIYYGSSVGIWYTVWWDSEDGEYFQHHWVNGCRYEPVLGYYSARDKTVIRTHMEFFQAAGIDFVVLDHTNGQGADNGNILKNINAIFETVEEMGVENAPKICFAIGAELYAGRNVHAQKQVADWIWETHASKPAYFNWKGKPLLVNFTTVEWFQWRDPRFTVRNAIGNILEGYEAASPETGLWGWVFNGQLTESEVRGVTPGWSRAHFGDNIIPTIDREGGERYSQMWLEAIKADPEVIMITNWNDFAEETAIEAAYARPVEEFSQTIGERPYRSGEAQQWTDYYGNPAPYWYQEMTFGYIQLKYGLVDEYYYREEQDTKVYQYSNGELVYQAELPEQHPVIVIPEGYFDWFKAKKQSK